MIKVTFSATYKLGKKTKTSVFGEYMNADADYKLRALALNWTVVKVEAA